MAEGGAIASLTPSTNQENEPHQYDTVGSCEFDDIEFDDIRLSLAGINLMLNNGFKESEDLFKKYSHYSPLMSAGSSFVTFMHALMTFEDENIDLAVHELKFTEKLCHKHHSFIKSMKTRLKRKPRPPSSIKPHPTTTTSPPTHLLTTENRLQRNIIIADCYMYQAVLTFTKQDITSYVKGGWSLRKAWKVYENVYHELTDMIETRTRNIAPNPPLSTQPSTTSDISDPTLSRLMGAVSFGYGLLHLSISMVPPSLLKVIHLLGFDGDRDVGLESLALAAKSEDMKAPLATLALLWYHTVVRPFFALDGSNVEAGICEAKSIIHSKMRDFPSSSLFLFFQGRILRLQGKIDDALIHYNTAVLSGRDQREIQLVCLYEIGWCEMLRMNWSSAATAFQKLKEESRWSQSYYAYLTAVMHGADGDLETALNLMNDVPKMAKRKTNNLEAFCTHKADSVLKMDDVTVDYMTLLAIEVIYLWRTLYACSRTTLITMIKYCDCLQEPSLSSLCSLLRGAVYYYLGDTELAIMGFDGAMNSGADHQVEAFACYELGVLLIQQPHTLQRGKYFLHRAKDHYHDYDFHNRLQVRIHNALQQLKDMGK